MFLSGRRDRPRPSGFDFSRHVRRLCDDFAERLDELRHVDMQRVAVTFSQTRNSAAQGRYATLTPLRFHGGQTHVVRRGRKWTMQRVLDEQGREMLYVLNFYLPRFLNLPFREKLVTVVHELWHIGPAFDGDLRRFASRCFAHGHSRKEYDDAMSALVDRWLSLGPPEDCYAFLRSDYAALRRDHGSVFGRRFPAPKLQPLS